MVYVDAHGHPQAVLSGSTNWDGVGPLYPEQQLHRDPLAGARAALLQYCTISRTTPKRRHSAAGQKAVSALQGATFAHRGCGEARGKPS